jgi:hypothetical protein
MCLHVNSLRFFKAGQFNHCLSRIESIKSAIQEGELSSVLNLFVETPMKKPRALAGEKATDCGR